MQVVIGGICAENETSIGRILGYIGCKGIQKPVDEITATCLFKYASDDEIAITVGRLVMAGFTVSIVGQKKCN